MRSCRLLLCAALLAFCQRWTLPTVLFVAWMRRTRTRDGQAAIDRFAEIRAERGRESLIPDETVSGTNATDAHDLLKDTGLEAEWKS